MSESSIRSVFSIQLIASWTATSADDVKIEVHENEMQDTGFLCACTGPCVKDLNKMPLIAQSEPFNYTTYEYTRLQEIAQQLEKEKIKAADAERARQEQERRNAEAEALRIQKEKLAALEEIKRIEQNREARKKGEMVGKGIVSGVKLMNLLLTGSPSWLR